MKPIRNSAKAVIVRDGHLLAIRNLDADGDWYLLPGGGQQPGETITDAVVRECLEEAGAEVTVGELRWVREYIGRHHEFAHEDGDAHQVEFMFACDVAPDYMPTSGAVPDTCQTGVVWLPLAELERFRIYPGVLRTLLHDDGAAGRAPVYLGDVN